MSEKRTTNSLFSDRDLAVGLALGGIGKAEFLRGPVNEEHVNALSTLRDLAENILGRIQPNSPLPKELRRAFRETQEGRSWTIPERYKILGAALEEAFANGTQPEIIRQEGNIIRVINSDDIEITIAGSGGKEFQVSATVGGHDIGLNIGKDKLLFNQLNNFVKNSFQEEEVKFENSVNVNNLIEKGTIVCSEFLKLDMDKETVNGLQKDIFKEQTKVWIRYQDTIHPVIVRYCYYPYEMDSCKRIMEINGSKVNTSDSSLINFLSQLGKFDHKYKF